MLNDEIPAGGDDYARGIRHMLNSHIFAGLNQTA